MVYWVLLFASTHLPSVDLGEENNPFGVFQVDKTLHVVLFGGLMFLLWRARPAGAGPSRLFHGLTALVLAVTYALVDEYTQRWAGRDVSASDVVAGLIGIVGVFLMITAPPARERAGLATALFRGLAFLTLTFFVIAAIAPWGNDLGHWVAHRLVTPWPGIDKAGHFYISALLTLLLAASALAGVHRPVWGVFLTILVMGLSGPIIETGQSMTGRNADLADLYAHQVGLLTAMLALTALPVARALRMRRRDRSLTDA